MQTHSAFLAIVIMMSLGIIISSFKIATKQASTSRAGYIHTCSISLSRARDIHTSVALFASPKRGSIVDSYRTINVSCSSCHAVLFKYKKKNGTKSSLVKMYIERIVDDPHGLLDSELRENETKESRGYHCKTCDKQFGRAAQIKGLPAIKIIGNRIRMK